MLGLSFLSIPFINFLVVSEKIPHQAGSQSSQIPALQSDLPGGETPKNKIMFLAAEVQ